MEHFKKLSSVLRLPGVCSAIAKLLTNRVFLGFVALATLTVPSYCQWIAQDETIVVNQPLSPRIEQIIKDFYKERGLPINIAREILRAFGENDIVGEQDAIRQKLLEKAAEYSELVERLRLLSGSNPDIEKYLVEAARLMSLGQFERADGQLAIAESFERDAIVAQETNLQKLGVVWLGKGNLRLPAAPPSHNHARPMCIFWGNNPRDPQDGA